MIATLVEEIKPLVLVELEFEFTGLLIIIALSDYHDSDKTNETIFFRNILLQRKQEKLERTMKQETKSTQMEKCELENQGTPNSKLF